MADHKKKIAMASALLTVWGVLLLQEQYDDAKIESLIKTDVQQSFRRRNLFLNDVDVKLIDKGSRTGNEIPIRVHVKFKPPFSSEAPTREPVDKTVLLLVSKSLSGDIVIKSSNGVELSEAKAL